MITLLYRGQSKKLHALALLLAVRGLQRNYFSIFFLLTQHKPNISQMHEQILNIKSLMSCLLQFL